MRGATVYERCTKSIHSLTEVTERVARSEDPVEVLTTGVDFAVVLEV